MPDSAEKTASSGAAVTLGVGAVLLAVSMWIGPTAVIGWDDDHWSCQAYDVSEYTAPAEALMSGVPQVDVDLLRREVECSWPIAETSDRFTVIIDQRSARGAVTTAVFLAIGVGLHCYAFVVRTKQRAATANPGM